MKVKLTNLAKKLGITYAEADEIKTLKIDSGDCSGKGKNTWLTEEAAAKFTLAVEVPSVVPINLIGMVIHGAPNPNWLFAKIEGLEGKWPIVVPRRLHGKLIGKKIPIHAITDAKGTTYRYASLTGRYL